MIITISSASISDISSIEMETPRIGKLYVYNIYWLFIPIYINYSLLYGLNLELSDKTLPRRKILRFFVDKYNLQYKLPINFNSILIIY